MFFCCVCCSSVVVAITDWHRKVKCRIEVIAIHFRRCDIAVAAAVAAKRERQRERENAERSLYRYRAIGRRFDIVPYLHTFLIYLYTLCQTKEKKQEKKRIINAKYCSGYTSPPHVSVVECSSVVCDKIKLCQMCVE